MSEIFNTKTQEDIRRFLSVEVPKLEQRIELAWGLIKDQLAMVDDLRASGTQDKKEHIDAVVEEITIQTERVGELEELLNTFTRWRSGINPEGGPGWRLQLEKEFFDRITHTGKGRFWVEVVAKRIMYNNNTETRRRDIVAEIELFEPVNPSENVGPRVSSAINDYDGILFDVTRDDRNFISTVKIKQEFIVGDKQVWL